jgi:hypothetical protein
VHDGRHATIDVGSALSTAIAPLWLSAAVVPASFVMPEPFDAGAADERSTASLDEPITVERPDAR